MNEHDLLMRIAASAMEIIRDTPRSQSTFEVTISHEDAAYLGILEDDE